MLPGVIFIGPGKLSKNLGLDCLPKYSWEFFFGWNVAKPVRDLMFGYVPEGYDQQAEEEAYRNRKKLNENSINN